MRNPLFAAPLCLLAAAPAQAGIVTASNLAGGYGPSTFRLDAGYAGPPNFTNETPGQLFVAEVGGQAESVTVHLYRWPGHDVPLEVSIHETSGGFPGQSLGQIVAPANLIPTTLGLVTFEFDGNGPLLSASETYAVVLHVNEPIIGSTRYGFVLVHSGTPFGIPPVESRDGGETWESARVSVEIGITVAVVPEPATLTFLGIGALAAFCRRYRS